MDFLGKKCPVCSKNFHEDDDIVVCPECGAPYHRECYKEKGKCIFTDLHQKGETWHDEDDDSSGDSPLDKCPHCGRENPKGAVICYACGGFMHKSAENPDGNNPDNQTGQQNPFNPFGSMPDNTQNTNQNGIPNGQNGNPFAVFIDPMGGVSPDEDFDGVTGAEMAKCVKVNTPYYMQVFSRIKTIGSSRFNFAAFLFGGGWYLYRKQYLKGTIITTIMFLLTLGQDFIAYATRDMWVTLYTMLKNSGIVSPTYIDYFSLMSSNFSWWEVCLLLAPYILSFLSFVLMLVCGFCGNRSYYKHTIMKVKKFKAEKSGEELTKTLSESGGVNTAIAWSLIACEIIMMIAMMFV